MKNNVHEILDSELNLKIDSISEIMDLGSVNSIFDITCKGESYIVRINPDRSKEFEFWKEKWCIEKVNSLSIPSPTVLKIGMINDLPFMIMNKIEGLNGSKCTQNEKIKIWRKLGEFASKFHSIEQIQELHIASDEFHNNWISKLDYNINQLSKNDSLLKRKAFTGKEQKSAQNILKTLKNKKFIKGLVHGDLCPRNAIWQNGKVFLLDWGSSKIDVVPHTEIGMVQMDNDLNEEEFKSFISGLGISNSEYKKIEKEIKIINFLNRLDLYRWADGNNILEIEEYIIKLRSTYEKMLN